MSGFERSGDALADQFRTFHAELVAYLGKLAEAPEPPEQVGAHLRGLIDAKARQLEGPRARDNGSEVRYLMAAFADEMLITRGWAHQEVWIDHLLEAQLFGTRNAGDRVFARIAGLRARADRAELAEPYLYALALGFRGRFGGAEENLGSLDQMRTELFKLARERAPDPVFRAQGAGNKELAIDDKLGARLMERAYRHTVGHGDPVMLPNPYRWRGYFFLAFGILLLLAFWIWNARTSDLRKMLHQSPKAAQGASVAGKILPAAPARPPLAAEGGRP